MNQPIKPIYVGIDVALRTLDISVIDQESNSYMPRKKKGAINSPSGLDSFVEHLKKVLEKHQFNKIFIGFEATGNYGFHLPYYFQSHPDLQNIELAIYRFNPKVIKNFRKAWGDMPKTDSCDSLLIAERLKIGKLPPFLNCDPQYHALRTLTRQRFDMVTKLAKEKTRFVSQLFIKASGFAQNSPFCQQTGATSAAILTDFGTMDDVADAEIDTLTEFILKKSKNKFKNAQSLAREVKYIARECYKIDRVLHDSISVALISSHRHIQFLTKEIKLLDKEISRIIPAFISQYKVLTSIPGISSVLAAGIIAEVGDVSAFPGHSQLAKFSGLTWHINQSGNFKAQETSLTKRGNRYLRFYLCSAAQSVIHHCDEFMMYYQKKYKEVPKHQHKRAVTITARKLVRTIFVLLKHKKLYVSPKGRFCLKLSSPV
jgi:transposase